MVRMHSWRGVRLIFTCKWVNIFAALIARRLVKSSLRVSCGCAGRLFVAREQIGCLIGRITNDNGLIGVILPKVVKPYKSDLASAHLAAGKQEGPALEVGAQWDWAGPSPISTTGAVNPHPRP